MKKSLIALGCILFIFACILFYHFSMSPETREETVDDPGKAYVDQTLPLLLADLSTENFFKYASQEFIDSTPKEDFDLMFDWFSRLGSLTSCHGAYGEIVTTIFPDKIEKQTGEYTARTEFESGPALVNVTIVKEDNVWKINGIRIESKALVQQ